MSWEGHRLISGAGSPKTSRPSREAGGGMSAAIVGTLAHHRRRGADGGPARRAGRHLPARVRRPRPARRPDPLHGRRHDRCAVDHDGPVHLHDLDPAVRLLGLRWFAGPGLPDAARSSSVRPKRCCGWFPTSCATAATRSGTGNGGRSSASFCPPPGRYHQRRDAGHRPRRGRDGAAAVHGRRAPEPSTRTSSAARTPPCRCRSSATPSSRSHRRKTEPGGPRSRWS